MSAGDTMPGLRGPDGDWSNDRQFGEYWRHDGRWFVITPNGRFVDVTTWKVTEHEDRTITVSPSIFAQRGRPDAWHGFLERGVWREV